MKKSEAVAHYKSMAALARALGITTAAVAQWDEIPGPRQYQIEVLTDGALKAERPPSTEPASDTPSDTAAA